MQKYNYLIVGAGLFGSVFTHEAIIHDKTCLVIDKRNHIGGNIYCEKTENINIHKYGAHIFHTSSNKIWKYINQFAEFNHYINSPIANYKGRLYNLPFNMNTFNRIWPDVITPEHAAKRIEEQTSCMKNKTLKNLEEQAIASIGEDIYKLLIQGYTEKQWGRPCTELPPSIIKRIPVRYIFDNNYFDDTYQGIPIGGYTQIIEKMLHNSDIKLNVDYFSDKNYFDNCADTIIYTGMIDEFYDYSFGKLEYRSLRFETEILPIPNFQGNAVINYTDLETPYTRIIEHKHFEYGKQPNTVITREYPEKWQSGNEPYYPINDEKNMVLYNKYTELASKQKKVIFGGRLGMYKYFDMDDAINSALNLAKQIL
jgi:UDP-galactopyranose mutase